MLGERETKEFPRKDVWRDQEKENCTRSESENADGGRKSLREPVEILGKECHYSIWDGNGI